MKASSHTSRRRLRLPLIWASVAIGLVLGLAGGQAPAADQAPVIKSIRSRPPETIGLSNKDMADICAAAISTVDSLPTSTIGVESMAQGRIRLSYSGAAGSPARRYACSIAGDKILLGRNGEASAKKTGERITFRLTADAIHITVVSADGAEKHGSFPR